MAAVSFSGIDPSFFQQQDLCATETAGAIQDRTLENLAPSDSAIVFSRNLLLKAIKDVQEGKDPQHICRDPQTNHFPAIVTTYGEIPKGLGWKNHCRGLTAADNGWQSRPQQARVQAETQGQGVSL